MDRNAILLEAGRAVKDRGDLYGRSDALFVMIAERWRLTIAQRHKIDLALTAEDVGLLMIDFKFARALSAPSHADSFVDLVGYAALLGELSTGGPITPTVPKSNLEKIDEDMAELAKKFAPKRPIVTAPGQINEAVAQ